MPSAPASRHGRFPFTVQVLQRRPCVPPSQSDVKKLSFFQFIILSLIPEAFFGCGSAGSAALRLCG
jgi:hypothetical protein